MFTIDPGKIVTPTLRCAYDTLLTPEELLPHPKNRNLHSDAQVKRLGLIIEKQGWRVPLRVSLHSGFITAGHGRLLAAIKMGWTHLPVNYQHYDSEAQEYADLQADNAIARWATLDFSEINNDITELGPDFDIDLLGIEGFEIEVADKKTFLQCPHCGNKLKRK